MTPLPFHPDPATTSRLLDDLANPHDALATIAKAYDTDLDSLSTWMARPDIAERLASMHDAIAQRARLCATSHLPLAIDTLVEMIRGFRHQETTGPLRTSGPEVALREAQRNNARRAIHLLLRIARFSPIGSSPGSAPPRGVPPRSLSARAPVPYGGNSVERGVAGMEGVARPCELGEVLEGEATGRVRVGVEGGARAIEAAEGPDAAPAAPARASHRRFASEIAPALLHLVLGQSPDTEPPPSPLVEPAESPAATGLEGRPLAPRTPPAPPSQEPEVQHLPRPRPSAVITHALGRTWCARPRAP